MRKLLLQCIALFLTALWLPAMQHCTLDAIGLIEAHVTHHDDATGCEHHTADTQHAHDTCIVVESTPWLNTAATVKTPPPSQRPAPPALAALLEIFSSALRIPESPSALRPFRLSAPPLDWIPARHFIRRAAPVSRAPSAIIS